MVKKQDIGTDEAPRPRGRTAGDGAIPTPTVKTSLAVETEKEIGQLYTEDIKKTKEALSKQPRVDFIIPLMPGEKDGAYETVQINGYKLTIKKGAIVNIPMQVAKILADSYKITAEAGKEWRLDRPFAPTDEKPISPREALT